VARPPLLGAADGVEPALYSEWVDRVESIAKELKRNHLPVPADFPRVVPPWGERPPPPPETAPQRLTLAVEQRGLLRDAAAAGLPVYDVVVVQMDEMEKNARVWFWVNLGVSLGVGLVAACILSLALRGRVREQTRPIGMLRAMGASDGQVQLIYLFVGVLLWLPGLALAAVLSLVTAGLLGLGSAAWASPFWAWPWPQLVAVAGVSGLISVASTLLATNGVVGTPPIELLRREQA
jgi:hypothetical protein